MLDKMICEYEKEGGGDILFWQFCHWVNIARFGEPKHCCVLIDLVFLTLKKAIVKGRCTQSLVRDIDMAVGRFCRFVMAKHEKKMVRRAARRYCKMILMAHNHVIIKTFSNE